MNTRLSPDTPKPVYTPKKSWLGLSDWIIDKIGVRPMTWKPILKVFKLIVAGSKYMEKPIFGPIYKRLMMFTPEEKTYSHGTIYNLNVDVSDQGESVVDSDFCSISRFWHDNRIKLAGPADQRNKTGRLAKPPRDCVTPP